MTAKSKFVPKTAEQLEQELNELSEIAKKKIESFGDSREQVMEHLRFMAQFHNFSPRNQALIKDQFMGAKAVGSFQFWRSKGVSIKKGEKGIKILAPAPVTYFLRGEEVVQLKHATPKEKEKIAKGEIPISKKTFYKIGHVFEYTQTNAREKGIEVSEIFGRYHRNGITIDNEQIFQRGIEKIAQNLGVRLLDTPPEELGTAKGAFYRNLNAIAMNPRNTAAESIPVYFHELAHADLHNNERNNQRERLLTVPEKEFQAEMTAYLVAARYGIEVENFSIPYLSNWTKDATLEDKERLLTEVRATAAKFIDVIDAEFENELLLEKHIERIGVIEFGALSKAELKTFSYDEFVEEMKQSQRFEQLQPIINKGYLSATDCQQMNELLGNRIHVFDVNSIHEPKVLISLSEHELLQENKMYRFAEANEIAGDISYQHRKDPGYFKTRYSLIVTDEKAELTIFTNTDRLDLGDGEYINIYYQLLREQRWSDELATIIEEDVKKFNQEKSYSVVFSNNKIINSSGREDLSKLTTEAMNKINSEFNGTLEKPLLMIQGVSEFKDFGMVNQLPFDELNQQKFTYTAAYPIADGIKIYSSTFDLNETLNPLHDLEKFEKLPLKELSVLSESWHEHLQREEDKYLEKVASRISKKFKNSKSNEYAMER